MTTETIPNISVEKQEEIFKDEKAMVTSHPLLLVDQEFLSIKTKTQSIVKLKLNNVQRIVFSRIEKLFIEKKPIRLLVLKARQTGISTLLEAILYSLVSMTEGVNALVIADDIKGSNYIFEMQKLFHEKLEGHLKPMLAHSNEKKLEFEGIHSQVLIDTADNKNAGRKFTLRYVHLCLDGDSSILVKDGFIKKLKDIKSGDEIKTHRGKRAIVKGLSEINTIEQFGSDKMIEVYTSGNTKNPIVCTPNHKIFVLDNRYGHRKNGGFWKEAKNITTRDYLGFPLIQVNGGQVNKIKMPYKPRKNRNKWAFSGQEIELDFDFGYFVGFYLAEGTAHESRINLALDKSEREIAYKIYDRIRDYVHGIKIREVKDSRTIVAEFCGISFMQCIVDHFGKVDSKVIPDRMWSAPREFLKGLIKGYIEGDGHLVKNNEMISLTSTRPQLLTQVRDLLVALRYGYSSLDRRPAGEYYGRKCKEVFVLRIHGKGAYKLRKDLGWPLYNRVKKPHSDWKSGVNYYWIPVTEIKETKKDIVYDIILDHKDHSYRTISGCGVHNSECAFFPDLESIMLGLSQSVPNAPGTMMILETTANGIGNAFHDRWVMASEGKSDWIPIFIPWFVLPEYKMALTDNKLYPIESIKSDKKKFIDEEIRLIKDFNLTKEQLNWRRWCIVNNCNGEIGKFRQEYPAYSEEAFLATGDLFFDKEALLQQKSRQPICGNIVKDQGRYVFRTDPVGVFRMYEMPRRGEQYVIGGDPAEGLPHGDKSSAVVINTRTNKTACTCNNNAAPEDFEEYLIKLGHFYNNAYIGCENKGYGYSINQGLFKRYGKVYKKIKTKKGFVEQTLDIGWNTNSVSRPTMLSQFSEEITNVSTDLMDKELIQQCWTFINNLQKARPEASRGKRDDLVFARAIAGQLRIRYPYKEKFVAPRGGKKRRGLSGY